MLADHALHVQAALTAAREDLDAVGGLTRGRVRLAGFPSASSTLVPAVLARLASTAPSVATSYVEVEPPEALDLVRSGEVDVALTFTHVGDDTGVDAALLSRPLGRDPLALVTPRTGAASGARTASGAEAASGPGAARGAGPASGAGPTGAPTSATAGPVDLAALRHARWIGGCPRCRGHLLASCAASGFTPDIVLETDNAAAVVGLVAAGLGVALLPRLALVTTVLPPQVEVAPADDDLARRVEVVVARGAERVPSVRATLEAVRAAAHLLDGPLPG